MTDALADLTIHYGLWLILGATFASCMAMPVPASLIMLSAGAFAAGDDFDLSSVAAAALLGAFVGDQAGFALGRLGAGFLDRVTGKPARTLDKARAFTHRHGGPGVFFSRWLFAPLAPYVNYIAGGMGMAWAQFSLWSALGGAVWVGLYTGAGFVFAEQLEAVATILSNASGAAAGLVITLGLGLWLWTQSAPRRRDR